MNNYTRINTELIQYTIDGLENLRGANTYVCDLHNEIFNTDYFLIGYYNCEKWLEKNVGVFDAIRTIQEWEINNFGVLNTPMTDSEKILNMYVYIKGDEILNELQSVHENWDSTIDDEILDNMITELKQML